MWAEDTGASFLMGAMRSPMRRSEVPYLNQVLAHKGYPVHTLFPTSHVNEASQAVENDGTQIEMGDIDLPPLFFEGMCSGPS